MVVTATGMDTRDGPDRDDADLGHADAVAAAEGARLADQRARGHRLGRRRVHRDRRCRPRSRSSATCCCWGPPWRSPRSRPGMPAFVSGLLSMGAKQLADAKAVVKNLTDVETLGATSAINTDKTGTLTHEPDDGLDPVHRRRVVHGRGRGLPPRPGALTLGGRRAGAGLHPAGARPRASTATPPSATTAASSAIPTEAALVVLAAKLGVDAEQTRRAYPRVAEVPFDSDYKFMATFHRVSGWTARSASSQLVKGGPDVVLARCTHAGRSDAAARRCRSTRPRQGIDAANERMGGAGPAGAGVRGPFRRATASSTR